VVFNATVPGKRIYALFGFAAINDFGLYLRALDKDVMILINDVAKVLHDEVYRWGFGDSGQCNKNLGAAFLMVFRIGGFEEVQAKKARATDVIFSSAEKRTNRKTSDYPKKRFGRDSAFTTRRGQQGLRRRRSSGEDDALTAEALQLASLPGIVPFTDRAVLGFLKCYAGIHRDQRLKDWKKDFRLGLGVGAFSVEMIFGMDAGWAVEGAVGSEYKIDATYLSPHVNMASRMMAASKQYGVSMLMSQAVEELLSEPARQKMRHLDTVFVKGSSIAQKIYTYDCRHKGVDFFLLDRSPEQADLDSERYTSQIWNQDPDLLAMRKHVTVEFEDAFAAGLSNYLDGDWKHALPLLKKADKIMIETVVEEGWVSDDVNGMEERLFNENDQTEEIRRLRQELGDGAARSLIAYIKEADCKAPNSWKGVRPLTSK
jgi:class 3 adenylate cyclase